MAAQHANLYSIFGSEALLTPLEHSYKLFEKIKNRNVETVVYHINYELEPYSLIQPDVAGFGRFSYLPTGERLFCRVRSFFGANEVFGRSLLQIEYGERREISILITSINNPLKQGAFRIIVAEWITYESRDESFGAPHAAKRAPSQAVYGTSIAPLVLIDSFVGKNKRPLSMGGYEVLWSGTTTIVESSMDTSGNVPLATSVQRGIANCQLAEWVVGVASRSKSYFPVVYACIPSAFNDVLKKNAVKINRRLEERSLAHRQDAELDPINTFSDAVAGANRFLEHTTIGAIVDLLARDTFRGVKLPIFNTPTKFPLYLTTCVFLAAFPELARLPNSGALNDEDASNASRLLQMYRSVTTGTDPATGVRTTAFEAILAVVCDGVGSIAPVNNGVKSGRRRSGASADDASQVHIIENMRRQGAALLQELFGEFADETRTWAAQKHTTLLGSSCAASAMDATSNQLVQLSTIERRRSARCTGSSASIARSCRSSRRDAMQRTVLGILVATNQFVSDGTFRMVRYASVNDATEDAAIGVASGIERNVNACQVVHSELASYFSVGISALIATGIPRIFPLRYGTVVVCGDCGVEFDPLGVFVRDSMANCECCNIIFCMDCYTIRVANMVAANNGNTLTVETMEAHANLMRCARCVKL